MDTNSIFINIRIQMLNSIAKYITSMAVGQIYTVSDACALGKFDKIWHPKIIIQELFF